MNLIKLPAYQVSDNKTFVLYYCSEADLDFSEQQLDKSVKLRPCSLHKSNK